MYITKNDIRYLPLDKLNRDITKVIEKYKEDRLMSLRSSIASANNAKMKMLVKDATKYVDPEAGSDGIEEAIYETASFIHPDDVELDATAISECNRLATKEVVEAFIATHSINTKHSWIMPQMKAYFGKWDPVRGEDGLYSARDTLVKNATDDFSRGLWYLAKWSRSDLIKEPGTKMYQLGEYNHLVPIILSGFRVHKDIKYSAWSRKGLRLLVDEDLANAMLYEVPDYSPEQFLEIRNDCLVYQTGTRTGQPRDPRTSHTLYGIDKYQKYPVKEIPKLAQVMLTQIWAAHPANRTKHMVLDPRDWDIMPHPLVDVKVTRGSSHTSDDTAPWING